MSPSEATNRRTDTCRSTPKKLSRRNNNSKLSHTHRNSFFIKKGIKSGKSSKKSKKSKLSSEKTFLEFLLKSTNNPMSFAKDLDHGHARSQFTYHATRSQGTTNAHTGKDTISPQSTNFIGTTRIMQSNQKYISEFKNTWEQACKEFIKKQS